MENSTELQKPNIEAELCNNNKKCEWICTYTHTAISKIKQSYKSKVQWIDSVNKGNQKLHLPEQN